MPDHLYGRSATDSRRRDRRGAIRRRHLITTIVVLAVLTLGLALGVRAALQVLSENTPVAPPTSAATTTAAWCPEPGALPLPPDQVPAVQVLNATGEGGLAGRVTDALAERGIAVGGAGNAPEDPGPVEIRHAPADYLGAVTVQAHLGSGQLVAVPDQQGIVVVLGAGHPDGLAPADQAAAVLSAEAPRPEGC